MPFDSNGWKKVPGNFPIIGMDRILNPYEKAAAALKAGASKKTYDDAYKAVKTAYTTIQQMEAKEKNAGHKQALSAFEKIGKTENNEIYSKMQKYNATLNNSIAMRQNNLTMMKGWNVAQIQQYVTDVKTLLAKAVIAFKANDKAKAAILKADAANLDVKRKWVDGMHKQYEAGTGPWRNAHTGLHANDLAAHIMPLTKAIYNIGGEVVKAYKEAQTLTAAWNTAKAIK